MTCRCVFVVAMWLVAVTMPAPGLAGSQAAGRPDEKALAPAVDALLATHGDGITASLWLGGPAGDAWFERAAATPRATASAIKTFYLVELFATYADHLDDPLPGTAAILGDDTHPAIGHFPPGERDEIRRDLGGASVRRVAAVMMGSAPASNAVYNAAANLITAVLGGPDALTARIHRRDSAFAGVAARRYMLRDRKERGDNEAPALAIARLYQHLASRQLAGIAAPTMDAIRQAVKQDDAPAGRHFSKDGNLPSDPMTEVRAGWYETAKGPLVYVVMTLQPVPGAAGRDAASQKLSRTATALGDALVSAVRP
jgi:hypothetical protein